MPAIDQLINIPTTQDPVNFSARADNLLSVQLPTFINQTNAVADALSNLSTNSTSTTSRTIATGSIAFTVETGKSFLNGQSLVVASTASPNNRMFGLVTSYNTGTGALVFQSQAFEGSGTFASWSISLAYNGILSLSQIQSVTSSVAANAMTLNYAGGTLSFRNPTLSNGAPITLIVAANAITIPSGATLGTASGVASRLILLEAYNGGTPVACVSNLAGGLQLDETNLISPTTISAGATSANVIYSASAVSANSSYRVVGYFDNIQTVAGTWATDATVKQGAGGQALKSLATRSMVRLNTANGYGSTNTVIRRFTNVVTNQGADILYTDSATLGATFTILTDGVYAISYSDTFNATSSLGLSLNSNQLTTGISSINANNMLSLGIATNTTASAAFCSATVFLNVGDVIRAHTLGTPTGTIAAQFIIVKVGS